MDYSDICEAKTKAEMQRRFEILLSEVAKKYGRTPEAWRPLQASNVGYFAGYYDREVSKRVHEWLGATHPIFGTGLADGTVTPEAALEAGKRLGAEAKRKRKP